MADDLKPCPFCGGQAKVKCTRVAEDLEDTWVECTNCFVSTDRIEGAYCEPEAAIDLWNRRK